MMMNPSWNRSGEQMRRRSKILISLGLLAGLPALILGAGLLYLTFGDLSRHRPFVERVLSGALKRELRINGTFKPKFSLTSSLVAEGVTLANAEWGSEPTILAIDRLSASVDLLSLFSGPAHLPHLEIAGARSLVEYSDDGIVNWIFDPTKKGLWRRITSGGFVVDRAEISETVVLVHVPGYEVPLELAASRLEFSSTESQTVELRLEGSLNGVDLDIEGQTEPLPGLLNAQNVVFDLGGTLGGADLVTAGRFTRLASLDGADFDFHLEGPVLDTLTRSIGLPPLSDGPFQLDAQIEPSPAGNRIVLTADLGELSARADGSLDALRSPGLIDLTVAASGPDLAAAGALIGFSPLPPEPFEIAGGLTWQGFPLSCNELTLRVGENHLQANGVLGKPPRMPGTDFTFRGKGPDISLLAALFGLEMPSDPFEFEGKLLRVENGLQIDAVHARAGRSTVDAGGFIGDSPGYDGTDFQVAVHGADLSRYSGLFGIELPAEPFELAGRLGTDGKNISIGDSRAAVGESTASIEGKIRLEEDHTETDLLLDIEGTNLSRFASYGGLKGFPARPYRATGRVGVHPDGWHFENARVDSSGLSLDFEGTLNPVPGFHGSTFQLVFAGPESSVLSNLTGLEKMAEGSFAVEGQIGIVDGGYQLHQLAVRVAETRVTIDGRVSTSMTPPGTTLRIDGQGESLAFFQNHLPTIPLPEIAFEIASGLSFDETGLRFDRLEIETETIRLAVSGQIAGDESLAGTDLELTLEGDDLQQTGASLAAAGIEGIPELPDKAYSISGRLEIDESGYLLQGVVAHIGTDTVCVDGRLGAFPEWRGTDLTLHGDGPDASLFKALTGGEIPVAPFQLRGRVECPDEEFQFHDVLMRFGEYQVVLDGILGEPPTLAGTDLDFTAAGPGMYLTKQFVDLPNALNRSFKITGHCKGSPEQFTISDFNARWGRSDFNGWFRLDLEGEKPVLQGNLSSESINFARLMEEQAAAADAAGPVEAVDDEAEPGLLLPDDPIDLSLLNSIDAAVHFSAREMLMPRTLYTDVSIGVHLEDGRLQVGPLSATGTDGGVLRGEFRVEPAEQGYRVNVNLDVDNGLFDVAKLVEESTNWIAMDIDIEFQGAGRSLHEIAATSDGFIVVAAREGVVDNTLFELVSSDFLMELLDAINPFRHEAPETRLRCSVITMNIEDGLATLDPLVLQTKKTSMIGDGEIDLATEEFELRWVTKPRKGIGLNPGMVTDSYVQLGGTLADPHLEVMPLRAALSTGLAVGTSGLSVLAKGLWNRITAHRDICKYALEDAEEQRAELKARYGGDL